MLRNLFATSSIAHDNKITLSSYLHTLKGDPAKLVSLLAIFILPSAALGWWYYSLAMSVGSATPLRSTAESSEEINISAPQNVTDLPTDPATPPSSSSSASSEKIDLKINSSSSNSSQTGAVEVNGQPIPIPADGSTHQVIQNDNGKTTVDINVDSDTSGSSTVRSSTNINLRSTSDIDVDVDSKEVR